MIRDIEDFPSKEIIKVTRTDGEKVEVDKTEFAYMKEFDLLAEVDHSSDAMTLDDVFPGYTP